MQKRRQYLIALTVIVLGGWRLTHPGNANAAGGRKLDSCAYSCQWIGDCSEALCYGCAGEPVCYDQGSHFCSAFATPVFCGGDS